MSHSTIDTAAPAAPRPKSQPSAARQALQALASLRLTVVLFALSAVLVFVGTLAMMESGIWTVVKAYFRSFYVWVPFQVFVNFGQVFKLWPEGTTVDGAFPFPGGWTLGAALLVNLLAAHLTRFRLMWRRSGILILHAGLGILLVSELITGLFAVESQMRIEQGETVNYVQNTHILELALTNTSDPKADDVVSVPMGLLRKGGTIRHEALPFDVEVVKYMVNSELVKRPPAGTANPATAGAGLDRVAVERPEVAGVSTKQEIDAASAYLTLRRKDGGEPIGTYLVSLWLLPQPVEVDGKRYDIELRFRREYEPFALTLIEFRFDRYLGTEVAKNYSSRVRLTDPERGEDREILIKMNDPLRYHGETFYQADFDKQTEKGTVLQVVRNPGWLIPYISCFLVTLGMVIHFGLNLTDFLSRRSAR
jgi:ResB-like family